ncbi:MAG: hypothetical protein G3M78_03575 [Candidatus Nitrohelix vancouverensis]|uniref:TRASH domain-containing protein n=1 Tax=Candidatus Nitrohelix vancouverensis TaxID=2705534 RepID=A0A7T0C0Z8_9BACT|nr:MAG: hypothetical protein G3M78_03575 [Candidatus Nitrohelix vancouverensis]
MARLILLGIILAMIPLVWSLIKPRTEETKETEMVACARCGTYVPKGEAVEKTESEHSVYFCGSQCADKPGES